MKRVLKVGAFVLRTGRNGACDLLLFNHPDHPDAPIQIPGGTVEEDESVEQALFREIAEETGLTNLTVERKLGVSEVPFVQNKPEILVRHCFLLRAPDDAPDSWIHTVKGAGLDEGLRFQFRWYRIEPEFTLSGDLGYFLSPEYIPELWVTPAERE